MDRKIFNADATYSKAVMNKTLSKEAHWNSVLREFVNQGLSQGFLHLNVPKAKK